MPLRYAPFGYTGDGLGARFLLDPGQDVLAGRRFAAMGRVLQPLVRAGLPQPVRVLPSGRVRLGVGRQMTQDRRVLRQRGGAGRCERQQEVDRAEGGAPAGPDGLRRWRGAGGWPRGCAVGGQALVTVRFAVRCVVGSLVGSVVRSLTGSVVRSLACSVLCPVVRARRRTAVERPRELPDSFRQRAGMLGQHLRQHIPRAGPSRDPALDERREPVAGGAVPQAVLHQGVHGLQRAGRGPGGRDQLGRVEESRPHHADRPVRGRGVQLLLGQAPGRRGEVSGNATAGPPRGVEQRELEVGALDVRGVLVPDQLLRRLRHERGAPVGGGERADVVRVRLVEQIAQGARTTARAQQPWQRRGILVRLPLGAQPGRPVRFPEGGGDVGPDVRVDVPGEQRVGQGGAHGVATPALPDAQQGVPLRDLTSAPGEGEGGQLRITAAQQGRGTAARPVACRGEQGRTQPFVQRHAVQCADDGPPQGRRAAGIAVHGGVHRHVVGGHEFLEDTCVDPGVAGERGLCPAFAVPSDGGGQ
ncbi:hypothetical protein CGZ69_02460 [Streptomyces peucetius subsp. caesius ATCC 27952]|nr:hypothetical protein CGZ69_02460 [Streptomyces peucetius subsp. caesius ATCC 27952]